MTTTTDPSYVDPTLINPRAVRLVKAFKDALARMRDEEGLTFDDLNAVTDLLQKAQAATGAPLALVAMPLFSEVFQGGRDGYTPSEEVNSPTYIAGSPRIDNPGILPMRPDEPGTPLVVSGRVLDGNRRPIEGAKVDIYHAANNGDYSALYDDGVPTYNLRGHLFTDADGRYTFTTVTPVAYADSHIRKVDGVVQAVAALGRSLYRPAHIHYEVHHPDLITPWRGEVYFKETRSSPSTSSAEPWPLPHCRPTPSCTRTPRTQQPQASRAPTVRWSSTSSSRPAPARTASPRTERRHDRRGRDRLGAGPAQHCFLPPLRPPRVRRGA